MDTDISLLVEWLHKEDADRVVQLAKQYPNVRIKRIPQKRNVLGYTRIKICFCGTLPDNLSNVRAFKQALREAHITRIEGC